MLGLASRGYWFRVSWSWFMSLGFWVSARSFKGRFPKQEVAQQTYIKAREACKSRIVGVML